MEYFIVLGFYYLKDDMIVINVYYRGNIVVHFPLMHNMSYCRHLEVNKTKCVDVSLCCQSLTTCQSNVLKLLSFKRQCIHVDQKDKFHKSIL